MSDRGAAPNKVPSKLASNVPNKAPSKPAEREPVHRHRGTLLIVSGPSGTGKGTLIANLPTAGVPDIAFSVSHTTRTPRAGEIEGDHYHFVSVDTFKRMIEAGDFLEWAEVYGNYYGTSRQAVASLIDAGRDVVLDIDVQGAAQVRALFPEAVSVLVVPPSYDELYQRLHGRGLDDPQVIARRLAAAPLEIGRYEEYDHVILNDHVETASGLLAAILLARRSRLDRMHARVREVLNAFPDDDSPPQNS